MTQMCYGITTTAGPFTIELDAGTYDVITQSHDDHVGHPGQFDQTEEQWYFTLDSGYISPLTTDIDEDNSLTIDQFDGQVIRAATSITLHHRGVGSVNSVDPICVGFTPSPEVQVAGPVLPVDEAIVETSEVAGVVEFAEVTEIAEAMALDAPLVASLATVDEEAVAPEAVEVDVAVLTQSAPQAVSGALPPVGQLALTGPSSQALVLVTGGVALLVLGGALVEQERRRPVRR